MKLVTTHICMTKDVGVHENLFGGEIMSWIDEAAAAYASEVCYTPHLVTGTVEKLVFENPVKVGDIIKIYCDTERIGNKSITLNVEARNFSPYTHDEKIVCRTQTTFVRIDERNGSTIPIDTRVKKEWLDSTKEIKKVFLIDIDGTICEDIPNEKAEKFPKAKHFPDALEILNGWYDEGHNITFFTARTSEHREVTEKWLADKGFKYHSLITDKPRIKDNEEYHWIDNKPVKATTYLNKFTKLVKSNKVVEVFKR